MQPAPEGTLSSDEAEDFFDSLGLTQLRELHDGVRQDCVRNAYGAKCGRLQQIKAAYHPKNVLHLKNQAPSPGIPALDSSPTQYLPRGQPKHGSASQ